MRTRRGLYPSPSDGITFFIRQRPAPHKRRKLSPSSFSSPAPSSSSSDASSSPVDLFDCLPDELVISIMAALSSTASLPADLFNAMLTCKRLCAAATHVEVLARACEAVLAVQASRWCDGAERFLRKCASAGNAEAAYTLGMIEFYCLEKRGDGLAMMAQAALTSSHAASLYSLAIIQFNGSGGERKDKNLQNGASLCAKAAALGHLDAIRELGHCLQDGYGVPKNPQEGRRLLCEANTREDRSSSSPSSSPSSSAATFQIAEESCPLNKHSHTANRFLTSWFGARPEARTRRLCSYGFCGRAETRKHEFRRCSACGCVNYCSRSCQASDWKLGHKQNCIAMAAAAAAQQYIAINAHIINHNANGFDQVNEDLDDVS